MLYSDLTVIALLSGVIIPILVGVLTKLDASSGLKAVLNAGLAALASLLAVVNEADFEWKPFLVNWGLIWAVSVATHFGFWKPTGVSDQVQKSTARFGIG